ncbi:MAG: ester cyclase [Chitinophagaceae bacterium]|nr:ester cyclase [Chitinophagaceae bacterium]
MKELLFSLLLLSSNYVLQAQTEIPANSKNHSIDKYISNHPLAAGLVRIGKEGIETGDNKVLDAYFSDDFVLHSASGDMNLTQLKALWINWRYALTDFTITREKIMVEGNMVAAHTIFSGKFDKELKQSAVGPLKPTGKLVKFEVISMFRFNNAGLLAEEWVMNDGISFLNQFGVDLLKQKK